MLEETVDYVLRDLRHPDGGFYSAEDADSEGEEGKFYVWSLDEVMEVLAAAGLSEAQAAAIAAWWGVTKSGNFEGHNILHIAGLSLEATGGPGRGAAPPEGLDRARAALFAHREQRIRPGLDDKVLTGWNAMFLHTLAEAAAALGRADWMEAARANARFLLTELRRTTAACCAHGRPTPRPTLRDAGPAISATPRTTPPSSERWSRWPRSTRSPGWPRPGRSPPACATCSPTPAGSTRPARTPKRSSPDPATSSTTPPRRPTHWPPTGCCGWPP